MTSLYWLSLHLIIGYHVGGDMVQYRPNVKFMQRLRFICPLLGGSRKGEQLYLTAEKNETYEAFNNFYYRKSLKVSFSDFQLNGYPFTHSSVVKGLEYSPNAKKCHYYRYYFWTSISLKTLAHLPWWPKNKYSQSSEIS